MHTGTQRSTDSKDPKEAKETKSKEETKEGEAKGVDREKKDTDEVKEPKEESFGESKPKIKLFEVESPHPAPGSRLGDHSALGRRNYMSNHRYLRRRRQDKQLQKQLYEITKKLKHSLDGERYKLKKVEMELTETRTQSKASAAQLEKMNERFEEMKRVTNNAHKEFENFNRFN